MPRTVIFSKIASVILDMEKLKDCLIEDFLSILNPSEITKFFKKCIKISRPIMMIDEKKIK